MHVLAHNYAKGIVMLSPFEILDFFFTLFKTPGNLFRRTSLNVKLLEVGLQFFYIIELFRALSKKIIFILKKKMQVVHNIQGIKRFFKENAEYPLRR